MAVVDRSDDGLCLGYRHKNSFVKQTNFNMEFLYSVQTNNLQSGPGYIAKVTRASDRVSGYVYKVMAILVPVLRNVICFGFNARVTLIIKRGKEM